METFYIITNYSKDENYEVTRQIQDYIEKRGRTCILCERDEEGNLLTDQIPKETDCVLTLGRRRNVDPGGQRIEEQASSVDRSEYGDTRIFDRD